MKNDNAESNEDEQRTRRLDWRLDGLMDPNVVVRTLLVARSSTRGDATRPRRLSNRRRNYAYLRYN